MNPNPNTHPSEPLDLLTLAAVKAEVERRQARQRAAWRLNGANPLAGHFDPRIERAAELGALTLWLDEQIAAADAALDQHYTLAEAGRAALAAAEKGVAA